MLSAIYLTNFRNYGSAAVEFAPGMNCIFGSNGQGKSNLLEAVYYLSLLRSFRTSNVNDLRQAGRDSFIVRGTVCDEQGMETQLSVMYGAERRMMVNQVLVYRASDFINKFICVALIPQDLSLVQGTPLIRRRFLDISISQVMPDYLRHLQAYSQALKSRNVMLKDQLKYPKATVTAYDTMLAKEGAFIECRRRDFISKVNEQLAKRSSGLLHDERIISLKYLMRQGFMLQDSEKSEEELADDILRMLEKNYEHDISSGSTSIGPHRSDFRFLMDNVAMMNYSSQGECRMASLALKLACLDVVRDSVDASNVMLLMDDVIGELDNERREYFFEAAQHVGQTLLACTQIPAELKGVERAFNVRGGTIVQKE